MADKIQMKTPLVEMDGDEMTRIIWKTVSYTHLNTDASLLAVISLP